MTHAGSRPVRIGIDVGGTFTDLQIFDARTEYRYRRLSRPTSNRLRTRTPCRLTRAPFADRGGNGEIVKIRPSLEATAS